MDVAPESQPVRASMSAAIGACLGAGALVCAVDLGSGLAGAGGGHALLISLALYAWPCLLLGLGAGAVHAAWRLTFGEGAGRRLWRRLRDDREVDRAAVAGLLAFAVAGAVYALGVSVLARTLVAGVQRQSVGALLFGALAVAGLPFAAVAGLPIYRLARRPAAWLPALGPLPAAAVLVVAGALLGVLAVIYIAMSRLDWRALDWPLFAAAGGYLAAIAGWLVIGYGPGRRLRLRLPARRQLAAASAVIAALLPLTLSAHDPSADTLDRITDETALARVLLTVARGLSDGDGDGYSALLGGADCDDSDPAVNPGADEIPGNGIDDNCLGGDREIRARAPAPPQVPTAHRFRFDGDLLFILLDTTRGDRLGVAGYRRDGVSLTPTLDQLAGRGGYFSRAFAQAPNTARSLPSIMTGRYPSQIAVDKPFKNFSVTTDEAVTLFELLADNGFVTAGFASHYYFEVNPGIRQGFASFDNRGARSMESSSKEIAAPRIVPRVLEHLAQPIADGQRRATFVHLFEPHSSYMVHDQFPAPSGRAGFRARYDAEIAFADSWIATLVEATADRPTLIVVASDHGEAFGEHRLEGRRVYYHGRSLHHEMLHVPLIIQIPGVEARQLDHPVGLIDLAPTVLDALGIAPPPTMTGRSQLPALLGEPAAPRPVYAELLPAPYFDHKAVAMVTADGAHKLIMRLVPDRRTELYALAKDPTEADDLADDDRALRDRLAEQVIDWMEVDLQQ